MFTVIICDKAVVHDCREKYSIYMRPLIENEEIAFCEWNIEADTLEESVPELERLIKSQKEWRAVVICDSGVIGEELLYAVNPFDYVGTKNIPETFADRNSIEQYRKYVRDTSQKALCNPLMKLSIWLSGYGTTMRPEVVQENTIKSVEPLSEAYCRVLKEEELSANDMETALSGACRFDCVQQQFRLEGELFNPPKSLIFIAESTADISAIEAQAMWKCHSEKEYSAFAQDNLYSHKARFAVYKLPRIHGKRRESDYFRFLSAVMIFCENDVPNDTMKQGKVYELYAEFDDDVIRKNCGEYIGKLKATLQRISLLKSRHDYVIRQPLDNELVRKEFEEDVRIRMEMPDKYVKDDFLYPYGNIGLSKDCPSDEEGCRKAGSGEIRKKFVRFLRQPQRSVRNAVNTQFAKYNRIDDMRVRQLNEFQKEDILYRLQEEEQRMTETETAEIFNIRRYNEMLDRADKELQKEIAQRMTRKKTLILSVLLLILSVPGFIPLFAGEAGAFATVSNSAGLIVATAVIISAVILVSLLVFRNSLVRKFKAVGKVMEDIFKEVVQSMETFSKYLSHVCNVMRAFSILAVFEQKEDILRNTYRMHETEINGCLENVMDLFSEYTQSITDTSVQPYEYDFSVACSYHYDFSNEISSRTIPFLHRGNTVRTSVDYIRCVMMRREELYV